MAAKKFPPIVPPYRLRPDIQQANVVLGLVRTHQCFDDLPPETYAIEGDPPKRIIDDKGKTVAKWQIDEEKIVVAYNLPVVLECFSYFMYGVLKFNLCYPRSRWSDKLKFTKELIRPFVSSESLNQLGKESSFSEEIHEALEMCRTTLRYLAYEACEGKTIETLHMLFGQEWDEEVEEKSLYFPRHWRFWPEYVYLLFEKRLLSHI